jgi:predicted transcriptional regulator
MVWKFPSFTFDPNKKGLRKVLGDLETEIMEIAWSRRQVTVKQAHEKLQQRRDLAYTTVMTVMSRLAEKGLLKRVREGAAYVYRPASTREEFTQSTVKKVMQELLRDFSAPAIRQFVESVGKEDPEQMEQLARLIDQKRKKTNV